MRTLVLCAVFAVTINGYDPMDDYTEEDSQAAASQMEQLEVTSTAKPMPSKPTPAKPTSAEPAPSPKRKVWKLEPIESRESNLWMLRAANYLEERPTVDIEAVAALMNNKPPALLLGILVGSFLMIVTLYLYRQLSLKQLRQLKEAQLQDHLSSLSTFELSPTWTAKDTIATLERMCERCEQSHLEELARQRNQSALHIVMTASTGLYRFQVVETETGLPIENHSAAFKEIQGLSEMLINLCANTADALLIQKANQLAQLVNLRQLEQQLGTAVQSRDESAIKAVLDDCQADKLMPSNYDVACKLHQTLFTSRELGQFIQERLTPQLALLAAGDNNPSSVPRAGEDPQPSSGAIADDTNRASPADNDDSQTPQSAGAWIQTDSAVEDGPIVEEVDAGTYDGGDDDPDGYIIVHQPETVQQILGQVGDQNLARQLQHDLNRLQVEQREAWARTHLQELLAERRHRERLYQNAHNHSNLMQEMRENTATTKKDIQRQQQNFEQQEKVAFQDRANAYHAERTSDIRNTLLSTLRNIFMATLLSLIFATLETSFTVRSSACALPASGWLSLGGFDAIRSINSAICSVSRFYTPIISGLVMLIFIVIYLVAGSIGGHVPAMVITAIAAYFPLRRVLTFLAPRMVQMLAPVLLAFARYICHNFKAEHGKRRTDAALRNGVSIIDLSDTYQPIASMRTPLMMVDWGLLVLIYMSMVAAAYYIVNHEPIHTAFTAWLGFAGVKQ